MNEQSKSLLVVKVAGRQPAQTIEAMRLALEPLALEIGAKILVSDGGADAVLHQNLGPLVDAMTKQVAAINRLAASNEALVQAMAEADDSGSGDIPALPMRGLDGRPL